MYVCIARGRDASLFSPEQVRVVAPANPSSHPPPAEKHLGWYSQE